MSTKNLPLAHMVSALTSAFLLLSPCTAQAVTITFEQNPDPFEAYENTLGITSSITATTDTRLAITNIDVGQPIHVGGDFDDKAQNVKLLSPTTYPFGPIAANGNFSIVFSWDAVDGSGINDFNFGLWFAGFLVHWATSTETGQSSTFVNLRVNDVPLPGALPLFATGLGALGLLGWWRKRKQAAA